MDKYSSFCRQLVYGTRVTKLHLNVASPCCKIPLSPIIGANMRSSAEAEVYAALDNDEVPKQCEKCITLENHGYDSLRTISNKNISSANRRLEIVFSNKCNMACDYCHPHFSSLLNNGVIIESSTYDIDISDFNEITVSGGEPLIQEKSIAFLKSLKDVKHLTKVSVYSNLSWGKATLSRLLELCIFLAPKMTVLTSCDAVGPDCNVRRIFMNFDLWSYNVITLLNNNVRVIVCITLSHKTCKLSHHVIEWILNVRNNVIPGCDLTFVVNHNSTEFNMLQTQYLDISEEKLHAYEKPYLDFFNQFAK